MQNGSIFCSCRPALAARKYFLNLVYQAVYCKTIQFLLSSFYKLWFCQFHILDENSNIAYASQKHGSCFVENSDEYKRNWCINITGHDHALITRSESSLCFLLPLLAVTVCRLICNIKERI